MEKEEKAQTVAPVSEIEIMYPEHAHGLNNSSRWRGLGPIADTTVVSPSQCHQVAH